MVVQEVHLSRPGESTCSDEKALHIQCLKLALKIAHSTLLYIEYTLIRNSLIEVLSLL